MSTVNISAYKFISLDDLPMLRERVLEHCTALALKGTVLLAPEGINLFLAGVARDAIDEFVAWLHADHRFADIVPKESLVRRGAVRPHACAAEEGNHHHAAADDAP
jgi:UPF0176 protein